VDVCVYAVVSVVSCLRFKVLRSWQGHRKLRFILYVVIVLVVQLMPLPSQTPSSLASFKSRLVLPFWYRLSQVILAKRPFNRCSVVVVLVIVQN